MIVQLDPRERRAVLGRFLVAMDDLLIGAAAVAGDESTAGPADGPPALAVDPRLALGVLLLGPGTHYPLHDHPAVEIYVTLTPGGEWWRGAGPSRGEPPATVIYHAPSVRHATRARVSPLLAVYLWCGDLATHARLTPAD